MNRVFVLALGCLVALASGVGCQKSDSEKPVAARPPCDGVDSEFEGSFDELAKLVALQTYRTVGFGNEDEFVTNMQAIVGELNAQVGDFNRTQKHHVIEPWEWKVESGDPAAPKYYWIFGFRLGSGPRKIALNTHFDTVSPGNSEAWQPFELSRATGETKHGGVQPLWVGRGAIDDKGPALATVLVLENI